MGREMQSGTERKRYQFDSLRGSLIQFGFHHEIIWDAIMNHISTMSAETMCMRVLAGKGAGELPETSNLGETFAYIDSSGLPTKEFCRNIYYPEDEQIYELGGVPCDKADLWYECFPDSKIELNKLHAKVEYTQLSDVEASFVKDPNKYKEFGKPEPGSIDSWAAEIEEEEVHRQWYVESGLDVLREDIEEVLAPLSTLESEPAPPFGFVKPKLRAYREPAVGQKKRIDILRDYMTLFEYIHQSTLMLSFGATPESVLVGDLLRIGWHPMTFEAGGLSEKPIIIGTLYTVWSHEVQQVFLKYNIVDVRTHNLVYDLPSYLYSEVAWDTKLSEFNNIFQSQHLTYTYDTSVVFNKPFALTLAKLRVGGHLIAEAIGNSTNAAKHKILSLIKRKVKCHDTKNQPEEIELITYHGAEEENNETAKKEEETNEEEHISPSAGPESGA